MEDPDCPASLELFRRRVGFLGMIGIAFTCSVYLMTLLRPVLEPFLWALFLVMALQPIATLFERLMLGWSQICCSRCMLKRGNRSRRCRLRCDPEEEQELTQLPCAEDANVVGDLWKVTEHTDVGSVCSGCWSCISRVVGVASALAVVLGVAVGMVTFIFDGAIKLKENYAIYEHGARNVMESTKDFVARLVGGMPRSVVDEIYENAANNAKAIVSELVAQLLSHASHLFIEVLMLGLYVMFWLCTPMPLNTKTESIFRRYLFLKGAACTCYGGCVGLMLHMLSVDLPVVFGVTSLLFSFIPEVGAFIAMALPMPVILFDSRLEAPFLTLLIATAGQLTLKFVFANIIEVKLVENDSTMKMHPVITLLAVTFFGFIWGPTGMLLSVPIMAYLKVVILSDLVPPAYRDPVLVILEGDRRAPERHRRRAGTM